MVGDLNCDGEDIICIQDALRSRNLWDAAAMPNLTGQQQPLLTCLAHRATTQKRRDFVLLSPVALRWAVKIEARDGAGHDVHTPSA